MRVLGLDPGPSEFGWALLECDSNWSRQRVLACGKIETGVAICPSAWARILANVTPNLWVVEEPIGFVIGRAVQANAVQGMLKNLLLTAKAATRLVVRLEERGMRVRELSAPDVRKMLTNKHAATNAEVAHWLSFVLEMPKRSNDHSRDAMAVAWAGWQRECK